MAISGRGASGWGFGAFAIRVVCFFCALFVPASCPHPHDKPTAATMTSVVAVLPFILPSDRQRSFEGTEVPFQCAYRTYNH